MTDNSFTWKLENGERVVRHLTIKGIDRYDQYLSENMSVPAVSTQEISQLIFGVDYGDPTDGLMFSKWGSAENSPVYFDETRKSKR